MKKSATTHKTAPPKTTPSKTAAGKRRGGASDAAKRGSTKAGGDGVTSQRGKGDPMRDGEEVQKSNDEHIDQDFPGYPHHPSRVGHGPTIHNGSAGAFDATEHSHDEDDEDQDNDDFAMDR